MYMYTFRGVISVWEATYGFLYDTSINQHNPFVISGNVAYNKSTAMGTGQWRQDNPSKKAVDGNVDPDVYHYHCAFVQQFGPLTFAWVVDLRYIYDIDKIILYASSSECI